MLLDYADAKIDTDMSVAEEYQAKFIDRKLVFESNQTANEAASPAPVSKIHGSLSCQN
jgi:hypothetical protein